MRAVVALNGGRRPMKLYENVINAVFVSFRSKGRGVIRNAFAPRDGGHLLLSLPHLVSPLPHISLLPFSIYLSLPPSLSLSLFLFSSHGNSFVFPLLSFFFLCPFFSYFCFYFLFFYFALGLPPYYSPCFSQARKLRDLEKTEESGEGGWRMVGWKDQATEGE